MTPNLQQLYKSARFQNMENKHLTPKSFIKTKQMREKYQCGICYEICIKPAQCKGPCGRIFCMKCVSDTRQVLDRCPCRCSSPFYIVPIPDIQIDFFCPYDPSNCNASIKSLKAFNEHYQICPYVSREEVYLKNLQIQYKCLNAHQLQFFIGSYQEMIASTCAQCKDQKLCRSYCRQCDQFYCVSCRIPPCSKEGCPIGHGYNFQRIANLNYICDMCGISTAVSNDGVYDDNHCNFGICQACYQQLPQKFDQSKPKSLIANINFQCACGQPLTYKDQVYSKSRCALCKKDKECPKYCNNCEISYCIKCKIVDIHSDNTCIYDHTFEKVNILANQSFMSKQRRFACMKCGKKHNSYFYDPKCFLRLCQDCFIYCMKVTTDKQRPVLLKCQKNHVLMYINGPDDYYDNCAICRKYKIVKLACNYCEQDKRTYCFQCKPIALNTCYYQHQLLLTQFEFEKECHFCIKKGSTFFSCRKCQFHVCQPCRESNLSNYIKQQGCPSCSGHNKMEQQI